jgi:hypothetical protein
MHVLDSARFAEMPNPPLVPAKVGTQLRNILLPRS